MDSADRPKPNVKIGVNNQINMKKFSKEELVGVTVIFLLLLVISIPNFALSIRRSRDQNRRDDIGGLAHGLEDYYADFGVFPKSNSDGEIIACKRPEAKVLVDEKGRLIVDLVPCVWGRDALVDLTPESNKVYIKALPVDPTHAKGDKYMYLSDGYRYQILAGMEAEDESGYSVGIFARKVMCGTRACNMGRSYNSPLNKSIEEYVNEIKK